MIQSMGIYQASETLKREAISWIASHPGQFAALAMKKFFYFWKPPFHLIGDSPSLLEVSARIIWAIEFLLLVLLAVLDLFFHRFRNRKLFIIFVSISLYTLVHMVFYVSFRYRLTIMPLVAILAAHLLGTYWPDRRKANS